MALPDKFKKIAGATVFGKSDRFKDGSGVLIVRNVLSKPGQKGDMFIMEFALESVTPKDGKPTNTVGSTVAQALNLTTNLSAAGNAKAFVLALLGVDDDPNLGETIGEICNDDPAAMYYDEKGIPVKDAQGAIQYMPVQPARGMRVAYETYHTTTKAGADFLGVNYSTIDDRNEDKAAIAKRRAAFNLDKPASAAKPAPKF